MSSTENFEKVKEELEKSCFVEDLYKYKKRIEDKRFGEVSLWTKKTGEDIVLMKEMKVGSVEHCHMIISFAQDRVRLNHDYLLKMLDFSVKIKSDHDFQVWGFYHAPMQDLKKEISRRNKLKK
jgi:hypothetical protein